MCECYRIGGRFIAEDPDCPAHGTEAVREREASEDRISSLESRVLTLEADNERLLSKIASLEADLGREYARTAPRSRKRHRLASLGD